MTAPLSTLHMPRVLSGDERERMRAELNKRYDDLEQSIQDILAGLELLNADRECYLEADHYYDGEVGVQFASRRVARLLDKHGVATIEDFNYARIPVDVVANRLQIASVVVAPAEENDDGQEAEEDAATKAAEKAIADLRKVNKMDEQEKYLHKLVSRHGSAYLLVWPTEGEDGAAGVDMRVNSAHNVRMIYDIEDPLLPSYVIKSWEITQDKKTVVRANLYYVDRIERWVTEPGASADNPASWKKLVDAPEIDVEDVAGDGLDDDGDEIANPWGIVTWFHFRNDFPHGYPEHKNAYGPQQMINKLVSADAAAIDFQSFPQRWLLVDPMLDDPHFNSEDPDHPDDEEDDPETETGTAGLSGDPGSVWKLWGKSVGQFDPAGADVFISRLNRYVEAMAELTDTPKYAFTKSSADMPSGQSLREMNGSTREKVHDRQDRYDPVWQDAYELALRMMGIEGVTVDVRWRPEMVQDSDGWGVLKQKNEAGVPASVTLEEAGYPSEQVQEWLTDLTGADMLHRVSIVERLGTAAQGFAAAVTAGVVSESTVQALFDRYLRLSAEGTADPEKDEDSLPAPKFRDPPPVNPAEAQAKAAQDFPAPPPKLAVDPDSGKVPENPMLQLAKMGAGPRGAQPRKPNGGR